MDSIKGIRNKVKMSKNIQLTQNPSSESSMNLKNLRKELEEKMNEKAKLYGFIGMEVYDLSKKENITIPQINGYLEKMDELNSEVEKVEKNISELERKNAKKNVCACGCKLKPQDRFCPNCGEMVPKDTVICTCGMELDKKTKFCSSCGKRMEDILKEQEGPAKLPVKECICGAKVPAGQFMCLECGRKVE